MSRFYFILCFILLLVIPVSAVEGDDYVGTSDYTTSSDVMVSDDSSDILDSSPSLLADSASDQSISLYSVSGSLSGGYYFVCDCVLGTDLTFYVPIEWAHDAFAFDSSGSLVNMSNSTCYAYCLDYPDYTFSCSRFGTFTYRYSNYSTLDLQVTDISDTNLSFLDDEGFHPSDSDVLVLIAGLIFIFGSAFMILRRR